MSRFILATRGSKLALAQAEWVIYRLHELLPNIKIKLKIIKTIGDKFLNLALSQFVGKGAFVKEIEDALLNGDADLAVHSMKDVPIKIPSGLTIASISKRDDHRDVLVSREGLTIEQMPIGGTIGTSSFRRKAQILAQWPHLKLVNLRGNVETRLCKMNEQSLMGVILAAAGLNRLGLAKEVNQHIFSEDIILPAIGQGALALEARVNDQATLSLLTHLNHFKTAVAMLAERAFMARLDGGCHVPIAGYARVQNNTIVLKGLVASFNGRLIVRGEGVSSFEEAANMGCQVAEDILSRGGDEILAQVYEGNPSDER